MLSAVMSHTHVVCELCLQVAELPAPLPPPQLTGTLADSDMSLAHGQACQHTPAGLKGISSNTIIIPSAACRPARGRGLKALHSSFCMQETA